MHVFSHHKNHIDGGPKKPPTDKVVCHLLSIDYEGEEERLQWHGQEERPVETTRNQTI